MKEKENLDRLFQQKFRDFEVTPSEHIWDNIEAELKEKKKRRVIPFWFRLSGVAAALLIGLLIAGKLFYSSDKSVNGVVVNDSIQKSDANKVKKFNPSKEVLVGTEKSKSNTGNDSNDTDLNANPNGNNQQIVNTEANDTIENRSAPKSDQSPQKRTNTLRPKKINRLNHSNDAIVQSENKQNQQKSKQSTLLKNVENAVAEVYSDEKPKAKSATNENVPPTKNIIERENVVTKNSPSDGNRNTEIATDGFLNDSTVVAAVEPNALEELLHEKEKEVTASEEQKLNRWQITSTVAPVYFSSASNGSPLDARFENNKKNYKPTVAYGVGAKYALNKKLAIRSGVHTVSMEYNTNEIMISQSSTARKLQNVNSNVKGSLIQVDNVPKMSSTSLNRTATTTQYGGSLNQKTGYIEVPVELSYKLVDKQFGVSLIGGLSTLFLNQNEVSVMSSGLVMNIGEANNLNSMHFSTNVGVGLKYSFLKAFEANFEPMFKYQMDTFSSDSGNFKPYFFGLYTGISYKF